MVMLLPRILMLQVVFEAAAPVGNTEALQTKEEQLFPHLVSGQPCCSLFEVQYSSSLVAHVHTLSPTLQRLQPSSPARLQCCHETHDMLWCPMLDFEEEPDCIVQLRVIYNKGGWV